MRVKNENLLTTATLTLASSQNLRPVWLGHIALFSVQLVFTGTPDGAFKLQGSNDVGSIDAADLDNQDNGLTNWTDITNTSTNISAAGSLLYNIPDSGYAWVRVVWTANSGGTTPLLTSARAYVKGF